MVSAAFHPYFKEIFSKIKDRSLKERIIKQFSKIRENPEVGKPMKYDRKGTREVYIHPFRLSYLYIKEENKVLFFDLYHKDEQ
ncbi:MAG: type II toxin-antitoxin system RelE/ParE family toxin [Candidatus Woesearchaeota archaeon]|nr:type II toxin-antitoxin system RelE/ParE family toxin [Candidatus Woesearchaeota archaeon]